MGAGFEVHLVLLSVLCTLAGVSGGGEGVGGASGEEVTDGVLRRDGVVLGEGGGGWSGRAEGVRCEGCGRARGGGGRGGG